MKNLLIFSCLLLFYFLSSPVNAQFDKFKSQGTLNVPEDSEAPGAVGAPGGPAVEPVTDPADMEEMDDEALNEDDSPQEDEQAAFGRPSNANTYQAPAADQKKSPYVNLNPETAFGPEVIESFDFPNADILDLTKHMQKLTGINLILDKDVKGKISILAPSPITVGDAWKAYLTALNLNGMTLVKSGAFYKIIQARDVRYTPAKIYSGRFTPDTDNYVMKIIPLKYIDVNEVQTTLRPLVSRYGRFMPIKQTNTLIIHDTGAQINRIQQILKILDIPGHDMTLQMIKMKHSSAQEIAKLIDQILNSSGSSRFRTSATKSTGNSKQNIDKIIAEPRTNSIIAMANADGAKELRELINKLDVTNPSAGSDRVHVYYLNYGDAESLSKTLGTLVSGAQSSASKDSKSLTTRATGATSSGDDGLFSADVKITADKENNALVVTASPTDYLTIKNVISKLDIPKEQVYVEGLIMETGVNKERGFGISLLGVYGSGATQKAGFQGADLINVITNNITDLSGLFYGAGVGPKVTRDLGDGTSVKVHTVNALIKALASNANTDILATPQILAQDNQEAVFEVGEKIPVVEKTIANNQTSLSNNTQEAKLSLKITPQINKVTRFVKLKIDQKIEDFASRPTEAGTGAETSFRNAVTTVVVRDRDTIAMGGLMRDKEVTTVNKVPLLGDIPVLGWLFKQQNKTVNKTNLLFFLTPKILAPYEKTASANMKDMLNRRSAHLKEVYGEDDPFAATSKGLYEKAKNQQAGPLYDPEEAEKFRKMNETLEGIGHKEAEADQDVPNYQAILREAEEFKQLPEDKQKEQILKEAEEEQKKVKKSEPSSVTSNIKPVAPLETKGELKAETMPEIIPQSELDQMNEGDKMDSGKEE